MARVVHFDLVADDPERCRKFYENAFGWKATKWEGPQEYWLITTGEEGSPGINGGLSRREEDPFSQPITNTIDVVSLDAAIQGVESNGGEIVLAKHAIPGVGWLAYFKDTEGNVFGMMQADESAA
ncbi:MAG: VOC family protein [Thermoplasmata archaeon]|nr:VOC family protein [Thermoplasmata archaeon]